MRDAAAHARGATGCELRTPVATPTPFSTATRSGWARSQRRQDTSTLLDWFNGENDLELNEDVVGLGPYGRTLTVLFPAQDLDQEEQDDDAWEPRLGEIATTTVRIRPPGS